MRTRQFALSLVIVASMLGILTGCEDDPVFQAASGIPVIEEYGPSGEISLVTKSTLDFGPVLIGTRVERKVVLRNDGRGSFRVEAVVESEGFDNAFRYQFESFSLGVGEHKEFSVFFEPSGAEGARESSLTLNVIDGSVETLVLDLKGTSVKGGCLVTPAESLDFGSVALGTSFTKQVKISNASDLDWKVTVGDITGELDAQSFAFSSFAKGEYTVPAHGELVVPIEFTPSHLGEHGAFLQLPAPAMCQPSVLPLRGSGVDQVLECLPKVLVKDSNGAEKWACRVDFGFVNPNSKALSQTTFRNLGNTDITVMGFELTQPAGKGDPFALETSEESFTVPAGGGEVAVPLSFLPKLLGLQTGKLHYLTDDEKSSEGDVELVGTGGGPDIEVQPSRVDFGRVGVGTYQYRKITIANVGTDVGGTTDDNLKLAQWDGDSWEEKRAELVTAYADEFTLEWPPQGYLPQGIAAGQNADLRVRFAPTSAGLKEATVRIFSTDPDEPVFEVQVVAGAEVLPPCDYTIVPSQLNFGNVESGRYTTLSFHIRNNASDPADECLVSTLGFSRGTPNAFSLPEGEISSASIPGGGSLEVPVRFAPRQDGQYSGAIEFYISSPDSPEGRVTVSGGSQQGCLLIAPNDLDFGVIEVNCNSRERTFTVYNVCPTTITIQSIEIQAGLSQEFKLTQRPALPHTLSSGSSTEFKATYRPGDIGEDSGSIALQTAQLAQPYVVTLAGRGATTAIQTDVFAQDAQPKVDVLLIIDDSCSMSDKQTSLGTNFASFIRFAISQQVDYHIAVTTTSVGSSSDYENGRFVPISGGNPRVITSTTPSKEQVFAQNVYVGTSGSGSEQLVRPGYLALSNPLIQTHNTNFLRDEANLALILVSDAADQDSTPLTFYQNFYLNIKGFKRQNMFTFSGIIPTQAVEPSGNCSYDESTAGQSMRAREMIARTAGVYDDICTPDWSTTLERLGQTAFGYRTRFFLSNVPDMTVQPKPIVVEVDGQPYDDVGSHGDVRWTYNSAANAIDFEPLAVPEPGSTLTISYHVACL